MSQNQQEFINQLPEILHLFSEPVTPHTASELWCRISTPNWDDCLPILLQELQSDDPRVVRLVLAILKMQSETIGPDSFISSIPTITEYLKHEDSLVRQATIHLLSAMQISNDLILSGLKSIMENDESYIATEAALAIIKLNPHEADGLIPYLIDKLRGDDFMIQSLVLENVELTGNHALKLLPHVSELLNEEGCEWDASFVYMKIKGDDAPARKIIGQWKETDNEIIRGTAFELEPEVNKFLNSF
ncbi:HEAT repeat domain-containing protein [Gimesia maris]|uniref:HEAT repeat domain-containing protein n=1 Tax=Gimesia maris TaxID=122 RepID=UPI0032EC8DDF